LNRSLATFRTSLASPPYDIDDEAERTPAQRPFPFTPTLDPADFLADYLADWPTPVIVYRTVAKHPRVPPLV
jgi:hypothetical protein